MKNKFKKILSIFLPIIMLMTGTTISANDSELITTNKTAEWVEGKEGQIGKIELTVNNNSTSIETVKTRIVLVIDKSKSMDSNNRLSDVKAAANVFVDDILSTATQYNADVEIAIVSYNSTATTTQIFTSNSTTLKSKINQITASDGTNIQAGIKTAQSLLDDETAENEIIVLLSDGEPTYSYRVNEATGITYSGKGVFTITDEAKITGVDYEDRVGNGRDYTLSSSNRETYSINNIYSSFPYNHGNTTIYEAGLAKYEGSEIYTIAYQANDTAKEVMKEVATSSNHAYESGNASAAFSAITSEIQNTIYSSQPKVIDEMGSGSAVSSDLSQYSYKFTIIENDPDYPITIKKDGKVVFNNYTINPQNQTIEWLLEDEKETFSNGVYTMTYYVQLDSNELGVGTYDNLYTNNDAELTYIDSEGINQSVKFPSPSLKLKIKGLTVTYTDGVDDIEVFEDQVYENIKSDSLTPMFEGTPEREGYTFVGWSPEVASTVTEDVVYEAQWKANEYTVRYTDGVENEEIFEDQIYEEMEYGIATPTFEGTLEREGYTFAGWSPEVASNVTGDVVYEAQWSKNEEIIEKPSVLPPTEDNDDKKATGIDVKEDASKAVNTGDNTNVGLLMIILFVSVFGITKYTWKKRF